MKLLKRKKIAERVVIGAYETMTLGELLERAAHAPSAAKVEVKRAESWDDYDSLVIEWEREETDNEYDGRLARWLATADKRKAADEKRKARLAEQRRKNEERERKEMARLVAKYGAAIK